MSGLSLRTSLSAGAGSYTPMTPASASPSTASPTIAQSAFGISGTGGYTGGPSTAAYGSIGVGVLALAALVYLWWSLPR
jgi:hypothetical protein